MPLMVQYSVVTDHEDLPLVWCYHMKLLYIKIILKLYLTKQRILPVTVKTTTTAAIAHRDITA